MQLSRIELYNFRNYARADIRPCPGITVFYGGNAQGKTALLEAVYLCCTGRSHRTSHDRELVRWGQQEGRVLINAHQRDGSHLVDMRLSAVARKSVKVNGAPISRSGELMGHVTGVLFSPEDLRMVKDGPAERRRFIDMELSQIRPAYYYALQRYNRALAQRGCVLRAGAAGGAQLNTLDEWDGQLAAAGAQIVACRRAFLDELSQTAQRIHAGLTGNAEKMELAYRPSIEGDAHAILRALFESRELDLRRGLNSVGPHRDDLQILLNGVDARAYGSQGQQRTAALSLKLSELEVMRASSGEYPVLMLDDVMSELDPMRRQALLECLSGVQTLISCTDPGDLAGARAGLMVRVKAGAALPDAGGEPAAGTASN